MSNCLEVNPFIFAWFFKNLCGVYFSHIFLPNTPDTHLPGARTVWYV